MKEHSYKIKRWDLIMQGNSLHQCAALYIKPDIDFVEFAHRNNSQAYCIISDSDTNYNDRLYKCTINKSSVVPNCRPNFFAESGLYIISLPTACGGYPKLNELGSVKFYSHTAPVTPIDQGIPTS